MTALALAFATFVGLASGPALFTYDELVTLSETPQPQQPLAGKLDALLTTPFVIRQPSANPRRPVVERIGPVLRAGLWNVQTGRELDLIVDALEDGPRLRAVAVQPWAEYQLRSLADADIMVLMESDVGMPRSEYHNVAQEAAAHLGMSLAFAVEFVEVDRLHLGLEEVPVPDAHKGAPVDPAQYRGLQGTGILSRYPIRNAAVERLQPCYDWYGTEKKNVAQLEKGKRWTTQTFFDDRIEREVRHGGRMALIVEIEVPESPTGVVTIIAPHLENKTKPSCRAVQMRQVLERVRTVRGPVIVAGDLNTTGNDAGPTSVRTEIKKRVASPRFWTERAINIVNPVTVSPYVGFPARYAKNHNDPTAVHVPYLAANGERRLFDHVLRFRFDDGASFDASGSADRNYQQRGRRFANSNARGLKGFQTTFAPPRDWYGVGRFKLDWFFVKPAGRRLFAPHFPMTMRELNESIAGRISDHHPLTVDLPLTEFSPPHRMLAGGGAASGDTTAQE